MRKIIHCDCDSFYASVELRDRPELASHPVAVGGSPDRRGVVATCNYEARKYGVHSALPMRIALRRCPELVVIQPAMAKYKAVSREVFGIFREYTRLIEPLSLDEAFLDVSHSDQHQGSASLIAREIRSRVQETLRITVSAGIAPNKFLAKIASDWNKPNGQYTIAPTEVQEFVRRLPVNKIFGVGSVTAEKLLRNGIRSCADLQQRSLNELTAGYGRLGARLYELSRGIDQRPVKPDRLRKSVSVETTYAEDRNSLQACEHELARLLPDLEERIESAQVAHRIHQATIKMRFSDFSTTTASIRQGSLSESLFLDLLRRAYARGSGKPVRLIGLGVSIADPEAALQLSLFTASELDHLRSEAEVE